MFGSDKLPLRRVLLMSLPLFSFGIAVAMPSTIATADVPAPVVTNVTPAQGARQGGTEVEITGENFTGATDVRFGNNASASSFTVDSDTSITAVSPAQTAEAYVVGITVEGPGGESAQTPTARFIYGPVVESVGPGQGPAAGGSTVTITGLGLQRTSEVDFGASPATDFSVNLDGSITAVAPPFTGGSASVPVSVTTPLGASNPPLDSTPGLLPRNYFAYGPTVTSIEPSTGPAAGGTQVTIHGTGFSSLSGGNEPAFVGPVVFGQTLLSCGSPPEPFGLPCAPTTFEVKSGTEITAVAPPGAGTVDLAVVTAGGISPNSSADRFSFEQPPAARTIDPRTAKLVHCKKPKVKRHGKCVKKKAKHHHRSQR